MTRKITITDSIKTTREVEIEHPIYRHYGDSLDSGTSYDVYERWDEDGTEWSIIETDECRPSARSYEIKRSRRNSGEGSDGCDFICGLGRYKCSENNFNAVLARAKEFINKID